MIAREFQVFRWAGASNDHQAEPMLLPGAGVRVNFTALPCGAERGAAVNEAPPEGTGVVVVVVGGVGPVPNAIQSRFWPSPVNASFRVCVPAASVTGAETVANVENDPVFGTAIVAACVPSTRSAMVRPLFGLATRAVIVYGPAGETVAV